MSQKEKDKFIRRHFSQQCTIILVDIMKQQGVKRRRLRRRRGHDVIKEENLVRRKYTCYICFGKFATNKELVEHKLLHKDDCEDEKSRESAASAENKNSQEEQEIIASEDSTIFNEIESEMSQDNPLLCSLSNSEVNMQSSMVEEKVITSDKQSETTEESSKLETNYKCLSCNIYFQNQVDIKTHAHNQYHCKYYCKLCRRQFNTKGGFIVHVLQHGISKSTTFCYKCDKCPLNFEDCYQLKRHYVSVHNILSESSTKSFENVPKTRENPIEIPENAALQSAPETEYSDIATESTLRNILSNSDLSNPITGSIPIFDCDVCYDVFASAKALIRHKALHRAMQGKNKMVGSTIFIEDDDIRVVQQDAWINPNEPVSHFRTVTKQPRDERPKSESLAKQTPMLPNKSASIVNDDIEETLNKSVVKTVINKAELTAQITQMLGGQLGSNAVPKLVPISTLPRPPLLTKRPTPHTGLTSASQSITHVPELHKIPVSVGASSTTAPNQSSQFINAFHYGSGVPPTSSIMSGNQGYFMIRPNSLPLSPGNPQEAGNNSMLSSSSSGQYVINQRVNSGGVGAIPTSNTSNTNFSFNPNIGPDASNQILTSLSNFSGLDTNQMVYVLVPTSEMNANANQQILETNQNNHGSLNPSMNDAFKRMVTTSDANPTIDFSGQEVEEQCIRLYAEEESNTSDKQSDCSLASSDAMVMPVITNVETSQYISTSPEKIESGNSSQDESSDFVMPIITSISSVAEEADIKNEKARKEPLSMYESEFAKFLEEKNDTVVYRPRRPRVDTIVLEGRSTSNPERQKEGIPDIILQTTAEEQADKNSLSNDDLLFLPEITDLTEQSEANVISEGNLFSSDVSQNLNSDIPTASNTGKKPKIFVKKLTDLLDLPPKSSDTTAGKARIQPIQYCEHCRMSFQQWRSYRVHMQNIHLKYPCKFFNCRILESHAEHTQHMELVHKCQTCGGEFRSIAAHRKNCFYCPTPIETINSDNDSVYFVS